MAYTVGEMARRLGVPASTIRYYDKEGLLPFVGRSSGGIRVFTEKDFEWLRIIECLKKTGMSLKDIREYIELAMQGDETIARRLELFRKQRTVLETRMAELQQTMDTLDYKCWFYETAAARGSTEGISDLPDEALPEALRPRIPASGFTYYGREVWEQALAALLCGENLLLAGGKATGKNVLAENLAAAFGRPAWDISFHVNMDAASLIGMDTFEGGQVKFRPGPVYRCAQNGGFGVLDEINMAKNEALAVLHAVLDFRRAIDVPGYERIPLAEETRFIATMNYGYAGTRELNEALTSRFVVIQMPTITEENLEKLLRTQFPDLNSKYVRQFALLFLDLQKKCDSAEISTKALDLRGMLDALRLMRRGVAAGAALDMGITNKAFDSYEQGLIRDAIAARIPAQLTAAKLFD